VIVGNKMETPKTDRFQEISNDYAELFIELFREKGVDYKALERTVFDSIDGMFRKDEQVHRYVRSEFPVLDVGIGDGTTIEAFVSAGYHELTGYDLNSEMLEASRNKFGRRVSLVEGDACDMSQFQTDQFKFIITGMCIHNIPRDQRVKFWKEILRLNPIVFSMIEKVHGDDKILYEDDYRVETEAMKKLFIGKYGLLKEADEWMRHYEYDEREDVRLSFQEVVDNLSPRYHIRVLHNSGMWKTIRAIRDNKVD
jgi:hypothetical protein